MHFKMVILINKNDTHITTVIGRGRGVGGRVIIEMMSEDSVSTYKTNGFLESHDAMPSGFRTKACHETSKSGKLT